MLCYADFEIIKIPSYGMTVVTLTIIQVDRQVTHMVSEIAIQKSFL